MIRLTVPNIGQEELEAVKEVLDSKFLVQGNRVREFEKNIQHYLNVKHAIAVSSGTAALHLALMGLEVGVGDEVIVPDFTFPATANVVEIVGATTRFVDIKLESFCIDVSKIEDVITEKTKVILPVHEFGNAADMDEILRLAQKYNLQVVEDAACALGTEYRGKKVGTLGKIGCFSLHPRKAITSGEGGIVVTNDDMMAERIRRLRNHGMCLTKEKIEFEMVGLNYRMTEIQGAIALVQLNKMQKIFEKRIDVVKKYNELLKKNRGITIPVQEKDCEHMWQTYHVILNNKIDRDAIIKQLKDRGIETNIGAYAVHEQPYYRNKYNYIDEAYSEASIAYHQGLALPIYAGMTEEMVERVVSELERCINAQNGYI